MEMDKVAAAGVSKQPQSTNNNKIILSLRTSDNYKVLSREYSNIAGSIHIFEKLSSISNSKTWTQISHILEDLPNYHIRTSI